MNYTEAISRLIAHASKTEHAGGIGAPCFGVEIYLISQGTGSLTRLRESFSDVISCLEVVNRFANGDIPSETFAKARPLAADLVYAVTEIMHEGWDFVISKTVLGTPVGELIPVFWAISHAWGALVGGDVDSLSEDLRLESRVRGIELEL